MMWSPVVVRPNRQHVEHVPSKIRFKVSCCHLNSSHSKFESVFSSVGCQRSILLVGGEGHFLNFGGVVHLPPPFGLAHTFLHTLGCITSELTCQCQT